MDWIVKIGDQEYRTPSVEELRQWHREGRIRPGGVVFHPILQRWMYPGDLEELRGVTRVVPTPRTRPSTAKTVLVTIAVVMIGLIALGALIALVGGKSAEEEKREEKAAQEQREKIRANMLKEAKGKLAALDPSAPLAEVARRCSAVAQLDASALTAEQKPKCADAHVRVAREEVAAGRVGEAHAALNAARAEGGDTDEIGEIETKLKAVEDRQQKKKAAEAKAASQREAKAKAETDRAARKAYGELLRNRFLDQGLDIKVRVEGKNSDRITLSFALFNDVWAHRIQKDGLLEEMQGMGFKRVELTDNYDYSVYWDFTKR